MVPTIAPTWKQHLAWTKLRDHITEFLVYGGAAGGGKSWLGCEWLLLMATMYPGTKWFIGRQELKQIRKSTIPTLHKVIKWHGLKADKLFKIDWKDNIIKFHNGSSIDLIELSYKPSDPLYERFGSLEYTGGWIEEAGEVQEDAANMISSRTGRQFNDKYNLLGKTLITCNPKKNWLYYQYYLPNKKKTLAENKAFIQALVEENKYGEKGYIKKLDGLKGISKQRLRFGIWEYDKDASALIDVEAMARIWGKKHIPTKAEVEQQLKNRAITEQEARKIKIRMTVDVARFGADSTVIGIWFGLHVQLRRYINLATTQTSKLVKEFQEIYGVPAHRVIVDGDGVGGGVVDQLNCRQFINGSSPFPNPVNPAFDEQTGDLLPEEYRNLKSQCGFRTADRINDGQITVEIINTGLDTQEAEESRLTEDMEQVKQKDVDTDGKRELLPKAEIKKIIGRSTDYYDTISMHELFYLDPEQSVWAH